MTAHLLGIHDANRFDLVGNCGGDTKAVTHVGLLADAKLLVAGARVSVLEMGPPLALNPPGTMEVHVSGTVSLTRDEAEGIEEWIAEVQTITSECRYLACPAAWIERDEVSGRVRSWSFSCAGFVAQAYEVGAGIRLVVEEGSLPALNFATVQRTWGHVAAERHRALARLVGLRGQGPWNVLVPGYLFHALNQPRSSLPYSPKANDIDFP